MSKEIYINPLGEELIGYVKERLKTEDLRDYYFYSYIYETKKIELESHDNNLHDISVFHSTRDEEAYYTHSCKTKASAMLAIAKYLEYRKKRYRCLSMRSGS